MDLITNVIMVIAHAPTTSKYQEPANTPLDSCRLRTVRLWLPLPTYCCSTSGCNAPDLNAVACHSSALVVFDEVLATSWLTSSSSTVLVGASGTAHSGTHSVSFKNLYTSPFVDFRCSACVRAHSSYSAWVITSQASITITSYLISGATHVSTQSHVIPQNAWTLVSGLIPAGVYDGVGFSISGGSTLPIKVPQAYIDVVTLA
eukprot:Phypoly_transcript_14759.p1 GENE.Phypoly_transcript_14759~~Phypoly_transcript_14759.p1  ORF type:complete len:203 (+),score=12.50 Phypoly_transcript_14759:239-847(+)